VVMTDPSTSPFVSVAARQLDLRAIRGFDQAIVVYENVEVVPVRALAPAGGALDLASQASGFAETAKRPLIGAAAPVLIGDALRSDGPITGAGVVVVGSTGTDAWQLTVDGQAIDRRPAYGWASAYAVTGPGDAMLTVRTSGAHRAFLSMQIVGWVAAILMAFQRRAVVGARVPEPEPDAVAGERVEDVPAPVLVGVGASTGVAAGGAEAVTISAAPVAVMEDLAGDPFAPEWSEDVESDEVEAFETFEVGDLEGFDGGADEPEHDAVEAGAAGNESDTPTSEDQRS
jgi:hypothetical protein